MRQPICTLAFSALVTVGLKGRAPLSPNHRPNTDDELLAVHLDAAVIEPRFPVTLTAARMHGSCRDPNRVVDPTDPLAVLVTKQLQGHAAVEQVIDCVLVTQ